MTFSKPRLARLASAAAVCMTTLAVGSCGSGSATVPTANSGTTATTSGIEGTGLAHPRVVRVGPIGAFGSIFLGGIEYDTTAASVRIDGQPGSTTALRAGQVITLNGSDAADGKTGTANAVAFDTAMQGPVTAVDVVNSSFTVLGRLVTVGPNTVLASSQGAVPLSALAVNAFVTVSGYPGPNASLVATRVDLLAAAAPLIATGAVAQADPASGTFVLNGLQVDYSAASVTGFSGAPANGDYVQVTATQSAAGAPLVASAVRQLATLGASSGDDGGFEGVVSAFASVNHFSVDGLPVAASATTTYVGGSASDVKPGVRLQVAGTVDATGTLAASQVTLLGIDPVLLRGPVASIDAAAGTLTVLGVTVATSATTRYDDESEGAAQTFSLASIAVGDVVDVRGQQVGPSQVDASLLIRDPGAAGGGVELRGTATQVAAPSLVLLGITATTGPATVYQDTSGQPLTASAFFARAGNTVVDLQGVAAGGGITVTLASLVGEGELDN